MEERAQLADVQDLYVYSAQDRRRRRCGSLIGGPRMQTETIRRRNQFARSQLAVCPKRDTLPFEVMNAIRPQLTAFANQLPPGYKCRSADRRRTR